MELGNVLLLRPRTNMEFRCKRAAEIWAARYLLGRKLK